MTPENAEDRPILTHINESGQAHMVDVSQRDVTVRTARASAKVLLSGEVISTLRDNSHPKGDVLAAARIAGIMGAKKTSELIPLCHPIAIHAVSVDLVIENDGVFIQTSATTADRTGVEMEALTAASIAALTVIDMVKSADPRASISHIHMDSKDGGRNGAWKR